MTPGPHLKNPSHAGDGAQGAESTSGNDARRRRRAAQDAEPGSTAVTAGTLCVTLGKAWRASSGYTWGMDTTTVKDDRKPQELSKGRDMQSRCQRSGTLERRDAAIRPYQWKKGESGNPAGGQVGRRFKSQVGDFLAQARINFEKYMTTARQNQFFTILMHHAAKGHPVAMQTLAERTMPVRKVPIHVDARSLTVHGDIIPGGLLATLAALKSVDLPSNSSDAEELGECVPEVVHNESDITSTDTAITG